MTSEHQSQHGVGHAAVERRPGLDAAGLNLLFNDARTYNGFLDEPLEEAALRELYDLLKMAPTSANSNPGRFVFLQSSGAKERLRPHLSPGNVEKAMSASAVVIVATDQAFFEYMPQLFPGRDVRSTFAGNPALAEDTAIRNATLQGAYLILAARALGYDVGPMSGFDKAGVDAEFFPNETWSSNFLVNLGRGDPATVWPRNPRLTFEQACRLL